MPSESRFEGAFLGPQRGQASRAQATLETLCECGPRLVAESQMTAPAFLLRRSALQRIAASWTKDGLHLSGPVGDDVRRSKETGEIR